MAENLLYANKFEGTMKVYEDNDRFFDVLWQQIDDAKDIICIQTYAMDHKNVAGITLQKLKNAAKRGVKVFLVIDDLCFYANMELIRQTDAAASVHGGMIIRNNPCGQYKISMFQDKPMTFF